MSSLKPVGVNTTISTSGTSAPTPNAISQQSDTIRVLAETVGVYVAIGTNPTATNANFYVGAGEPEQISIGPVGSSRIAGITTGNPTLIDFPEGQSSVFGVGEAVTLTVPGQSGYDFSHKIILAVDVTAGNDGFFGRRITVDNDSSTGAPAELNTSLGELRRSIKVAVKAESGTGKAYIQQVQVS